MLRPSRSPSPSIGACGTRTSGARSPTRPCSSKHSSSAGRNWPASVPDLPPFAPQAGTFPWTELEDVHMNLEAEADEARARRRPLAHRPAAAMTRSPSPRLFSPLLDVRRSGSGTRSGTSAENCTNSSAVSSDWASGIRRSSSRYTHRGQPVYFTHHLLAYVRCSNATPNGSVIATDG